MPLSGDLIRTGDLPRTVYEVDNTDQLNLSVGGYQTGSPEVGVYFIAPSSGKVLITTGGGTRDNGATADRVFLSPQVFSRDVNGTEVLAPNVETFGYCGAGISTGYTYGSRTGLLEGLTPGQVYYARVMMAAETTGNTSDVNCREITVEPVL